MERLTTDPRRIRPCNLAVEGAGPVIYWMSRDQRASNNWALNHAIERANALGQPVIVAFTLLPGFLGATSRQYDFMLRGLAEVETVLRSMDVPLVVLNGDPASSIAGYADSIGAGAVVADFSPLRLPRSWKRAAAERLTCAFCEVDAHNIVPCWVASSRQEYAARTIRPKLQALFPTFMQAPPVLTPRFQSTLSSLPLVNWNALVAGMRHERDIGPVSWLEPGREAAKVRLRRFITEALGRYSPTRNDPNARSTSCLSPYLHFGQISPQEVLAEAMSAPADAVNRDAFAEQLFIRRELAENFCFHNDRYDSFDAIPEWAKTTLTRHLGDHRPYRYALAGYEQATTHDALWNAAQRELACTGIMHNYMRMYWAKKILEWSPGPAEALDIAVTLNDRYALDGRDPNGYAGIAWAIGGLHDRPWFERPVFGSVRYMNAAGCSRKFNVHRYISEVDARCRER